MSLGDLQSNRGAESPSSELTLERLQQVFVAVLFDLQIGVARHSKECGVPPRSFRETARRQMRGDQVLQRQELRLLRGFRYDHESLDVVGDLDSARISPGRASGSRTSTREIQGEPGDIAKRMRRIDPLAASEPERPWTGSSRPAADALPRSGRPSARSGCLRPASAGWTSSRKQRACRIGQALELRSASLANVSRGDGPSGRRHLQAHVSAAL